MKEITFRPLRYSKKFGKIIVASYSQWNKVRCANYNEFKLKVVPDYESMDKEAFVYDHTGELLYHFDYNPWEVFTYHSAVGEYHIDFDALRKEHGSFSISHEGSDWISRMWRGADCHGTPTFSHGTAHWISQPGSHNPFDYEPVTVGYVLDWLGWFLYQLENSKLTVAPK